MTTQPYRIPPRGAPRYIRIDNLEADRTVELWPGEGGHDSKRVWTMDFLLHEIMGHGEGAPGSYTVPLYGLMDRGQDFPSADIARSEPYCQGTVKWDGCCNFTFPFQDDCMLHRCGEGDMKHDAKAWEILYREARRIMGEDCK